MADDQYEPNDSKAQAYELTGASGTISGTSLNDDWYKITVPADRGVFYGHLDIGPVAQLHVYDASGHEIQVFRPSGTVWSFDHEAVTQTYYVEIALLQEGESDYSLSWSTFPADNFTVTTLDDELDSASATFVDFGGAEDISLREALVLAAVSSGGSDVTFAAGGTVTLGTALGDLSLNDAVIIDGDVNHDGTPDVTINGSNSARIVLNSDQIALNGLTVNAPIVGSGGFHKQGTGDLILNGTDTYTGATWVEEGLLRVNGSIVSAVTVEDGGVLDGTGTVGAVALQAGGLIAPGSGGIGVLHAGNLSLAAGSTYTVEIGDPGPNAGQIGPYDKLQVTGTVSLDGATLDLSFPSAAQSSFGDQFTLIDNDGTDAVVGTFAGYAEGAQFVLDSRVYNISYHGGDGNDVVLTSMSVPDGGVLDGTGTVGAVAVLAGGKIAPGTGAGGIGVLHTGNLSLAAGSTYAVEIGDDPGVFPGQVGANDKLQVSGTVSLDGATLDLSISSAAPPNGGDQFTLIDNDGTDAVVGTFAGYAEGAQFALGNRVYSISYHGGDGNDVVLTTVNRPPAITLTNNHIAENSRPGEVIGNLIIRDPDDNGIRSIVAAPPFEASTGAVRELGSFDYEFTPTASLLVGVTDTSGSFSSVIFTIFIDDVNEAPTGIALSNASVNENSAIGTVVGDLSAADPDHTESFTYSLTDNPGGLFAISGNQLVVNGPLDYETVQSRDVTVRVTDKGGLTFDKTFSIAIGNVDDSQLAIAPLSASKPEGDAGTTPFTFTVTRSGDLSFVTTVNYAITGSGGHPADADDFGGTLPSGTVSLAVGESSKTITVNVAGDTVVEADEGFTVTLSSPSGAATIATATATGLIQADDVTHLAIAAATPSALEGSGAPGALVFMVTRSGTLTGATSVDYAVTGSGAHPTDASDFFPGSALSGTVTFAAGETTKLIVLATNGDSMVEADESFTVTLSNAGFATVDVATASGLIVNDDTPPADLTLIGDNTNNVLTGGAGDDLLKGLGGDDTLAGGAGHNILAGGTGNDLYIVSSPTDVILEYANEGTDEVHTDLASFSIVPFANVENLTGTATTAQRLTGNARDNVITGGDGGDNLLGGNGHDTLIGGTGNDWLNGGAGADAMTGGAGNDTYVVDHAGDLVNEVAGGGNDTVIAKVSYTLAAGSEVETLRAGSDAGLTLTGNEIANRIVGGAGADRLVGGGGHDILTGGAGADTFVFEHAATSIDTVRDFVSGVDHIEISAADFGGGLVAGALDPNAFAANATGKPADASDRFVYDTSNGALYFDADGSGHGATRELVAKFTGGVMLHASDFLIV